MARHGRQGVTGNQRVQDHLRSAEKLELQQREADLKELMNLPAGRRFLWDMIDRRCNAHGTGYSASGSETYFLLGQRDVGVTLRRDLERVDFALFAQIMLEALKEAADGRLHHEGAESRAAEDDADDE